MVRRPVIALVVAFGLLAVGCESTGGRPGDARSSGEARGGAERETVTIPKGVMAQVDAEIDRDRLLLADRVIVDASSDPFFVELTSTVDERHVEKTEAIDAERRMTLIRYFNRTGVTDMEAYLPQIRFGDGFKIVATKEILVRLHNRVDAEQPVFLDIKASGNVIHFDAATDERKAGDQLRLFYGVRKRVDEYRFVGDAGTSGR